MFYHIIEVINSEKAKNKKDMFNEVKQDCKSFF